MQPQVPILRLETGRKRRRKRRKTKQSPPQRRETSSDTPRKKRRRKRRRTKIENTGVDAARKKKRKRKTENNANTTVSTNTSATTNTFDNLFDRIQTRDYKWVLLEDHIPMPLYKWHVSKTRIRPSSDTDSPKAESFGNKLKTPFLHLADKCSSPRQKVTIDDKGSQKATVDEAPSRFWKRLEAKAFPEKRNSDYWTKLLLSMECGTDTNKLEQSDTLQFSKSSGYSSNLMSGGRVPMAFGTLFFKVGPVVGRDAKVTFKVARNADCTFDVYFSIMRDFTMKAALSGGIALPALSKIGAGPIGAVSVRPYKNERHWSFVQRGISVKNAAHLLQKFSENKVHDVSSFTAEGWTVTNGAAVSFVTGTHYNLLASAPIPTGIVFSESVEDERVTSASFATETPVIGTVAIERTRAVDPDTGKTPNGKYTLKGNVSAEHTLQTYWNIEPPELRQTRDDGVHVRIKGDTEDCGTGGLFSKTTVINEQDTLTDLFTKKKIVESGSKTIHYKPTFANRGHPQFTNPIKQKFGSEFYSGVLRRAHQVMDTQDLGSVTFHIQYSLTESAKEEMQRRYQLARGNWEKDFKKEEKKILEKPKDYQNKVKVDIYLTLEKEYRKGGTFSLPFLGRQQDGAAVTATKKYKLFNGPQAAVR